LLVRLEALTIDEIAVRDLPRLLDVAVKVERQAMGLEGSRVAVDVVAIRRELPVDISRRILSTPEGRNFAARQIEDLARAGDAALERFSAEAEALIGNVQRNH
jgi:hypothetical protein